MIGLGTRLNPRQLIALNRRVGGSSIHFFAPAHKSAGRTGLGLAESRGFCIYRAASRAWYDESFIREPGAPGGQHPVGSYHSCSADLCVPPVYGPPAEFRVSSFAGDAPV